MRFLAVNAVVVMLLWERYRKHGGILPEECWNRWRDNSGARDNNEVGRNWEKL
jgi:hypothetical protein